MLSETDKDHRRLRLAAVKAAGKALLKLKPQGLAMTALRESRVSASGWPDFFVSGQSGRIACLALCMEDGSKHAAPELFDGTTMPGSPASLAARLREVQQSWKENHPDSTVAPSLMILCPQWPEASLRGEWPQLCMDDILLAGKESCEPARLMAALRRLPASTAGDTDITLLRAFLAPETVLQPAVNPAERRKQVKAQQLSLLPQLLDYDQDLCAKLDLWLPCEGRDAAENFSLRLITGAAGTGKSVVLVHRAALLRQFHAGARIAVITHNRALRSDLESRFQRICGSGGVEFLTFYAWLGRRWPSSLRTIDDWERNAFLPESGWDSLFLRDEFDWIHDQGLQSVEEYIAIERTGRTRGLRESQRREVYALLEQYSHQLAAAQATDWSRRAFTALGETQRGTLYDYILVDETQFFARTWLTLIRSALRPGGHLFLCADPAQGFLGRGQSWRDAGLEVKGRSIVLKRPYRNTRQILSFAAARYDEYIRDDEEAPRLQETQPGALRDGPEPAEINVATPQEEISAVVRQAQQLTAAGTPPGDILILCTRRRQVTDVSHHLTACGLTPSGLDAPPAERQNTILLGTLDAATGLERPIVILCGLRDWQTREQNPALSAEDRRRERRLNASRFYMGCTRATQRLVIIRCGAN